MAATDVSIRRVIVNPPGFDVDSEAVFVHNGGGEDVVLTDWRLSDTLNHPGATLSFRFPAFTLLAGADVAVHTRAGTDDGQNLFWGRVDAVWNNRGDRAVLLDNTGAKIAELPWPAAPPAGRAINLDDIRRDLAGVGPVHVGGPTQPSTDVQWALGPNGGEIFWQEFGPTGAVFHAGFPDSLGGGPAPDATIINVSESIYRKYIDLGGPRVMGRPLSRRIEVPVRPGHPPAHRQEFEGGSIYRSPNTGAHLVTGAIRAKWLSPDGGGPSGQMGLPISDERTDSSGVIFSDFELGSIWFTNNVAEVLLGLVIEFTGFHCFGETSGLGSDEPFFHVSVVPLDPPIDNPTDMDGTWFTALPTNRASYEGVDDGDTVAETNLVYIGRATPLVVKTHLMEHDEGDPNAYKAEIKQAVAAAGAITAFFVPAASAVATNPDVQATVTSIINAIAGTDDDFIGQREFRLGSRREILATLNTPPGAEFAGVPAHRDAFLEDGDASYKAYFTLRRWEPPTT